MSFLPPKWPVETPITRARSSLWDRCILALPFWQTRPRNVVAGAFTTIIGSPALVATPRGYGLDFNGNDQGLSVPVAFTSQAITISFMFRRTAMNTDTRVLIEHTENFNTTNFTFSIFLLSDNKIKVNIHDTGGRYSQKSFNLPPVGEMVFCTATFELSDVSGGRHQVGLWINGSNPSGTFIQNNTIPTDQPFGGGASFPIHIAARAGNALEAQTQFSSVMVHDRLLSDAEIKLLHADPFQMFAPDMGAIAALAGDAAASTTTLNRTATVTGTSSVIATATITRPRAATVSAASTASAVATRAVSRASTVSAASTVAALATRTIQRAVIVTAQSSLSAVSSGDLTRNVSIAGSSSLTAQHTVTRPRTSAVAALSALTATRALTTRRSVAIAAASTVSATASGGIARSVLIEASSTTSAVTQLSKARTASVTATSTAISVANHRAQRSVQIDAGVALTAVSLRTLQRQTAIAANSNVDATASGSAVVFRIAFPGDGPTTASPSTTSPNTAKAFAIH